MPSEMSQANGSEARLLGDERFLRKVAYMYYEDGSSQEAIAEKEYVSRQTVSKALQKAKDRGIVRVSIVPDMRSGYLRNLMREARLGLELEDVVLVPGTNFEEMEEHATSEEVVIEIAKAAADYLDQLLTNTDVLAVSGGTTFMRNVTRHMNPSKLLPHLQVVATIGFVEAHTSDGDANLIAYDIAQAYGGRHTWCCASAIFSAFPSALATINLMKQRDPIVKQSAGLHDRANIVMMSIWPPHTNNEVVLRGILSREQMQQIESMYPAVDINHWVFDAEGQCINTLLDPPPYYLTGFEIPRLRQKIRTEGAKVIVVAGGGPAYVPALRATLKAGLANILITDHVTAQLLLSEK
jgi:DNA-binding transcriptional regulator LsrR (DeoR family)